eukprot:9694381-Ditylum_brightwellii.AAC.1
MLGAMDYRYCILLALGNFLEEWVEMGDVYLTEFLNSSCYDMLKKHVLDSREFCQVREDGCLEHHSFKKFGVTHPCCCGFLKDDVDVRAHWKVKKQQQDEYVNVTLPWPNVK